MAERSLRGNGTDQLIQEGIFFVLDGATPDRTGQDRTGHQRVNVLFDVLNVLLQLIKLKLGLQKVQLKLTDLRAELVDVGLESVDVILGSQIEQKREKDTQPEKKDLPNSLRALFAKKMFRRSSCRSFRGNHLDISSLVLLLLSQCTIAVAYHHPTSR
eukprot:scaffold3604_cov275-Pinguiococcus_pyrenoidosus.AAC.3